MYNFSDNSDINACYVFFFHPESYGCMHETIS